MAKIRTGLLSLVALLLVVAIQAKSYSKSHSKSYSFAPTRKSALLDANAKAKATATTKNTLSINDLVNTPRGGGADTPTHGQIMGVSTFILLELALRNVFKANGITFPAQLAGCVLLFGSLIAAQIISPGLGDSISNSLTPGAAFLAKWMGVFFVPGLVMLPLAPAPSSSLEIVKALGVVVVGFYYSLALVTYSVLAVRTMLGAVKTQPPTPPSKKTKAASATAQKPYQQETLSFLLKGMVTCGLLRLALNYVDIQGLDKPMETLFFGLVTLASYVWGANLPSNITKIFNPLLTSAILTLAVAKCISLLATDLAFTDVLRSYTCKKLNPLQTGAGDILLFLLSPSVISFGVGMYKGKQLIAQNLPAVVTAVLSGSVGSMFGTAFAARLLNLGGPEGQVLRLAAVPRSTQTALGMTIAGMLGGDIAIAATLIILTGIYGGMMGVKTLNAWGVKDSVSRGLGMGSAGLSLGVVSIKGEPEAFAFAGLCLVLTAVSATCLASVPAIKDMLISIAGGAPQVVTP